MDASLFLIRRTEADADRISRQQLEALDLAASSLLQQSQPAKALDLMEQALNHRLSLYGTAEAVSYCRSIAKKIVIAAVQQLEKSDIQQPLGLLHRVEQMMMQFPAVKLVCESCDVYNNIACAYRKQGRMALAKQYILKALKLAAVYREAPVDRAATHLNMCAILSSMGQHSAALDYGLRAVQYAQEDLVNASLKGNNDAPHKVTVLAVAYHNAGVEEEHLCHKEAALNWYDKALRFIETHGSEKHKQVRKEFRRTYKAALKALADSKAKGETAESRVKPTLPLKRRPVSAYKHERRYKPLASPSQQGSEEDSQNSVQPMLQTASQTHIRSSFPIRRHSPPQHDIDFYLRNPLEGKPQTFEAIRKQRTQSRASAVAERGRGSRRRKRPENRVESDDDLKELEAMGLLDYSLEPTRRDPAKAGVKRVIRGKRKQARSPQRHTAEINRKASDSRTETSPLAEQSAHMGEEELEQSMPTRVEEGLDSIGKVGKVEDPKEKEQAAIRIQAAYRGQLSRRKVRIYKLAAGKLIGRCGKQLSIGKTAVISMYKTTTRMYKLIADIDTSRRLTMDVSISEEMDWREVISRVELRDNKLILLPAVKNQATSEEVIRLQAFLRGAIARRRFRLLKYAKSRGRTVIMRTARLVKGRYVQLVLSKDMLSPALYVSSGSTEVLIPPKLATGSVEEIVSSVTIKDGKIAFSAHSSPASPTGKPSSATEVDEATVTRLQSIIRMRKQQTQYNSLKAKQAKTKEKLIQRELQLQSAPYLVTLTRLVAAKTEIEVEAYPLQSIDFMPKKTKYNEENVAKAYGWSGDVSSHAQELIAEVRVEGTAAVLRKLTVAFQQLFYQTYKDFEGILYEITFKEVEKSVEISIKPDMGEEITATLSRPEANLRILAGVEDHWLPRHFETLVSRLSLSKHSLILSEKALIPKPSFTIAVQETKEANAVTTDAYTRIAIPSLKAENSAAAVLIQSQIRRFLAKKEVLVYRAQRKAVHRTYRVWPDGRSFAVEMCAKKGLGVEIKAVDIANRKEYTGEMGTEGTDISLNYEEISRKVWTSASRLYVFSPDKMQSVQHRAVTEIARIFRGKLARKLYPGLVSLSKRRFQLCCKREFYGETMGIAVYSLTGYIQLEVFPLRKSGKGKQRAKYALFSRKDLALCYSNTQDYYRVLASCVGYEGEMVSVQVRVAAREADRALLVVSKRLGTQICDVTMSINSRKEGKIAQNSEDIVEFAAYTSEQRTDYRLKVSLEEVKRLSGVPQSSLYAQGSVFIHKLLKLEGGQLCISAETSVPSAEAYAVIIQAHVRGFLARRRLVAAASVRSFPVISVVTQFEGGNWRISAYREKPYIRLQALNYSSKAVFSTLISEEVLKLPGSPSKALVLIRNVLPRLYLEETSGRRRMRLRKSIQQSWIMRYQGKMTVIVEEKQAETQQIQVSSMSIEAKNAVKSDLIASDFVDLPESQSSSFPVIPKSPAHPSLPPFSSPSLPPFSSPSPRLEALPESPTSPSHLERSLVLRSGVELQSRYLVASIYHRNSHSLLVELSDPDNLEKVGKEISISEEEIREINKYCSDLLTRIRLMKGAEGRLDFEVASAPEAVLEVLYKKSHYVSDRYCVVTFADTQLGVVISAFDPQRGKTLVLRLGKCGELSAEQLQREIAALAKRLRIQEVLGEETLVLAGS